MIGSVTDRLRMRLASWIRWLVPDEGPQGSVQWWRGRMLGAMLLVFGGLGAILLVPMLNLAVRGGAYSVVLVDAGVFSLVIAAVFARNAPRPLRAWTLVLLTWLLGTFFSLGWGGEAAGPLWLIAAPILAGVLLGVRGAVTTLALVIATTLVVGALVARQLLPWVFVSRVTSPEDALVVWTILGANLVFLSVVGALATAILTRGLADEVNARLRAEEERLLIGRALEESDEIVLLVDREGTIRHINHGDRFALGTSARTLEESGLQVEGGPEMTLPWRDAFNGTTWSGRGTRLTPDGARQYLVSIAPVKDAAGVVSRALVMLRDITREQALEERLRVSAKLEAVGTMVGGIAHDFNNLLQPIIANTEELLQQLPADGEAASRLTDIERSATRGRGLVRRILTFSRGIEVPRVATALANVCEEAVRLTEIPRTPGIQLTLQLAPDVWVLADPAELHHVVVNLITNARDAMPSGGALRIRVSRDGDDAVLSVTDSGIGMDEATQARMFVPFFSTKGPGGGSGLGLATVHGTITALHGQIDVRTAPAHGTTITIRLPAIAPPERTVSSAPCAPADRSAGSRAVLLVDDDDTVRRAVARLVQRLGYTVQDTGDPAHALALLAGSDPPVELLLTDLTMPTMTGIALAAAARAQRPTLRVVLMTGMVDTVHADAARAQGVTHVIQKPFSQHELEAALRDALVAT